MQNVNVSENGKNNVRHEPGAAIEPTMFVSVVYPMNTSISLKHTKTT